MSDIDKILFRQSESHANTFARTVETDEQRSFLAGALVGPAKAIQEAVSAALTQSLGTAELQKSVTPNPQSASVHFVSKGVHAKSGAMATVLVTLSGYGPEFQKPEEVLYDLSVRLLLRLRPGLPAGDVIDVATNPNALGKGRPGIAANQLCAAINSELARRLT